MDIKKLQELMAQKKASMKKAEKTVKVASGKNRIRLLPGWRKGEEYVWFHDFGQHFIKDAADQIKAVYLCTDATFEKPCEVCAALATAQHAITDDATAEVLAKAKASRTVLINALMLDSTEPNTPVILELKRGVFGQLVDIVEEWGASVLDPVEGKEIVITRDGKGLNTKYSAQISPKQYQVPAASLTKLNDLDAYVKQESDEQQRRAIAAVNSVAGFLPSPSDIPGTSPSRLASSSRPSVSTDFDDVAEFTETRAGSSSADADISLDSDLDALLSDLG
ncbi:hypothetical protein [Undibacterium sp. 5I1]|uniref:hypothetical protein n=3 Tax=unclassified Undibacterium TaxID=2630295 RepID=UPI002B23E66F|nr:hypothetical protein [Undibacterium sp. 5I1]